MSYFQKRHSTAWRLIIPVMIAVGALALSFVLSTAVAVGDAGIEPQAGASGQPLGTNGGVLYDQTDSASGNGAPDQEFEAAFSIYSSEAADDFVVPPGTTWVIDGINTMGTNSAVGASTDVNVAFYADVAGFPDADGNEICDYPDHTAYTNSAGNLTIDLSASPCVLGEGTYWMAIAIDMDFGGGNGQHFWSNRTVQSNSESVWRNPGGGFGVGCLDWDRQATVCGVGGGAAPDFLFQIEGTVGAPMAIDFDKTVGLDPNVCATTDEITIPASYDVTYCYTMINTGGVTIATHTVVDDQLGTLLGPDFPFVVGPGSGVYFTVTVALTETTVNSATWWARDAAGAGISASDTATVTRSAPTGVSLSGFAGESASTAAPIGLAALAVLVLGLGFALRRRIFA